MNNIIVVSRHKNAIRFIADQLMAAMKHNPRIMRGHPYLTYYEAGEDYIDFFTEEGGYIVESVPLYRYDVNSDIVKGKVVIGNLPLSLAAQCDRYYAVEHDSGRADDGTEQFVLRAYEIEYVPAICPDCFSVDIKMRENGIECLLCGAYYG
jgi:hypothetical protein